jgi:hypothetical protein
MRKRSDLLNELDNIETEERTLAEVNNLAEYMGYRAIKAPDGWILGEPSLSDPTIYEVVGSPYKSLQEFKMYVLGLKQKRDEQIDRLAEQRYYEQQMEQALSQQGE